MNSEKELLLGLDLGISTAKAALFDTEGNLLATASEEYLILPEGNIVEADPDVYWKPLVRVVKEVLQKWNGDRDRIRAVSVSSHTETLIPLTDQGEPVRPAIVWMDGRSRPQANELAGAFSPARVMQITGQPEITPIWPLTKIRWMRDNEPELFSKSKFLLPEDYILCRLCGRMVAEQTVWSSSLVLDIRKKSWSPELMEFGGIESHQLPELCAPGTVLGDITESAAQETGLSRTTKVVAGALDQICAALAAASITSGIVSASTGSVVALVATTDAPVLREDCRIPCHIHALPDTYCLLPWNPTGGLVFRWFRDLLTAPNSSKAAACPFSYEFLTEEAGRIPPGCDGMVMLPHLDGALFPEYDPHARGVFYGITLTHSRGHFVRAILEAVAFMLRRDLEGLRKLGVSAHEVRLLGGGARSRLWLEINANVCQTPIAIPSQQESAALGAAILAAVGCGLFIDIPSAVRSMTSISQTIHPDPGQANVYEDAFRLYKNLYRSVKGLYADSAEVIKQNKMKE